MLPIVEEGVIPSMIYDRTFFEKGNGMKNLEGGDYL